MFYLILHDVYELNQCNLVFSSHPKVERVHSELEVINTCCTNSGRDNRCSELSGIYI